MNPYTAEMMPVRAIAPRQLRISPVGSSKPPENDSQPATSTRVSAEKAEPKLPQPPYTPSAKPISFGGNHSATMRMPITNPAPTMDSSRRATTS